MAIPLDYVIKDYLSRRKGTLTFSNVLGRTLLDFLPGLDARSALNTRSERKSVKQNDRTPETHTDFAFCKTFLQGWYTANPDANKEWLRGEAHGVLGRAVPVRVFDRAFAIIFSRALGRPRKAK